MTQRVQFIAAATFFLIVGAVGGFFSYAGLDAADKWSSIISMFLTLASFTLSALLFRQSMVSGSAITPVRETAPPSKYSITSHHAKHQYIGDNQTHDTTINKDNKDDKPN